MGNSDKQLGDRALELFAVILLGLATVATAWCAYEAARWNDRETDEVRSSAASTLEANRLYGLATQKVSYDATMSALYAQALVQNQPMLTGFYKDNLVRPEFRPVLEEWERQAQAGGDLTNLLENDEYLQEQFGPSQAADAMSGEAASRARDASDNASDFVQMTIFLAAALFLAGVTGNFRSRGMRILLLVGCSSVFAFALARIADLPTA